MNRWLESSRVYIVIKRIIDVIFSIAFLVILFPVMLIIAILLKMKGNGPVIFRQERLGRSGRIFKIYKFRSMSLATPSMAAKDINEQNYVTPLGKVLRKTSLDELPQLINILKGEMSFVGPRPLIPNEGIINDRRKEMGIDTLRPGLTGWAQIKARDTEDQNEKLKLDLYYKMNKSIYLDIKILFMTFSAMIHDKEKNQFTNNDSVE